MILHMKKEELWRANGEFFSIVYRAHLLRSFIEVDIFTQLLFASQLYPTSQANTHSDKHTHKSQHICS